MKRFLRIVFAWPARQHFWGSLAIVLVVGAILAERMSDRSNFADSELHKDVMERWGAPIRQPAPSVRTVASGAVFNTLAPLALARQDVTIDATMNYRKRGLVYFSGFDFVFRGAYTATNSENHDVDVVFVFPIDLEKNKTLLSDLEFVVNGAPAEANLAEADKLVWTGRIASGQSVDFSVSFRGRGLDAFSYVLDPGAPVRGFHLAAHISGGANFDYADGVVPAGETRVTGDQAWLDWRFASLESGIPVGVILPSEKSFDRLIGTMVSRSWAPFVLLFAAIAGATLVARRQLAFYESYLIAATYALFFVLTAYFAAFMHFYVAFGLAFAIGSGLIFAYLRWLLPAQPPLRILALLGATLLTPNIAVILEGYTGLIYTLETTVLVSGLLYLSTRDTLRSELSRLEALHA